MLSVLGFSACSTAFHGVAKRTADQQEKDETSEVSSKADAELGTIEDVEEDIIADEPVMTNGSFLTCVSGPASADPVKFTAIDCNLMTSPTEVAKTSNGVQAELKIFNELNYEVAGRLEQVPTETLSWRVIASTSDLAGARVELVLTHKASGAVRSKLATIDGAGPIGGSAHVRELEGPFHLGDEKDAAKDCVESFGKPRLFGREIKHKFTINADGTVLGINLWGLCDVSYNGNRLVVRNSQGKEVVATDIRKGTKDQLIPGRQLGAGDYELTISSVKRGIPLRANFDDFFINKIELVASGEVLLEGK
jgi:hypothetical protein